MRSVTCSIYVQVKRQAICALLAVLASMRVLQDTACVADTLSEAQRARAHVLQSFVSLLRQALQSARYHQIRHVRDVVVEALSSLDDLAPAPKPQRRSRPMLAAARQPRHVTASRKGPWLHQKQATPRAEPAQHSEPSSPVGSGSQDEHAPPSRCVACHRCNRASPGLQLLLMVSVRLHLMCSLHTRVLEDVTTVLLQCVLAGQAGARRGAGLWRPSVRARAAAVAARAARAASSHAAPPRLPLAAAQDCARGAGVSRLPGWRGRDRRRCC